MKITFATTLLLLLSSTVTSRSVPQSDLVLRDAEAASMLLGGPEFPYLEKRRGGGGGGRGGSGGSSSSGGGSGGRSGGGGSSSSRGGGGSGSSRSSNAGGSSSRGSGTPRSFGGGAYYSGGARTPYTAGKRSPLGLTPFLLPLGALAFFPGLWLYGAYAYPYNHPYHYVNRTSNQNETIPVACLCQEYSVCGCDDNNNSTYLNSILNGSEPTNSSLVRIANVNGTEKIYINGTLPNGTTAPADSSSASAVHILQLSGYWVMVAAVVSTVYIL